MKTTVSLLLFTFLVGANLFGDSTYKTIGIINDDRVRIRSQPNTTSDILGSLNRGTVVEVQDLDNFQSTNAGVDYWVKVKQNSTEGWVFGSYVAIKDALALTYDTSGNDNLSLSSYESSVYAISAKTVLLDSNLKPITTVPFGTELLLAQGTMIGVPPEYDNYLKRKFILENQQIEAYCPVQTMDDRKLYLVAEKDISVSLVRNADSAYFLKRRYVFSTSYANGKQLFILPKPSLLEIRGTTQRTLWSSTSNIDESGLSAEAILAFTTVEGLFICKVLSYGGRLVGGGGWTSSVVIMKNANGSLQFLKSLELSHFED